MLPFIKTIFNHRFFAWLVLAIPAPALLADVFTRERYYAEIMYESGLLSVQLLVLALALTPLMRLSKKWAKVRIVIRWLILHRRAVGVASFGYAALHTYFYLREVGSLELVWLELSEISLTTGWLAFAILLVLAATSNMFSVLRLGKNWKPLQRGAYIAAVFTAIHWYFIGQYQMELLLWFTPLAMLQMMRLTR
ncbi:MAG: ferric reductase-like transmembrane domain-containing protein [Rhizobiaceae bacterium]